MKRYRCPHCGKKVFSPAHYSFMRFVSTKRMYAEFSPHSTSVLRCPSCTQVRAFFHHDNMYFNLESVCSLLKAPLRNYIYDSKNRPHRGKPQWGRFVYCYYSARSNLTAMPSTSI